MSPIYRSPGQVMRKWMGWILTLALPIILTILVGKNPDTFVSIPLPAGRTASVIAQDPTDHQLYAVIEDSAVVRLNFDARRFERVAAADNVDDLIVMDGIGYQLGGHGEVTAIRFEDGKSLWNRTGGRATGLALIDSNRLAVIEAPSQKISVLDNSTGEVLVTRRLDGVPMGLTYKTDRLIVTLYDRNTAVVLDPSTLSERRRLTTGRGPLAVTAVSDGLWIENRLDHEVTMVDDADRVRGKLLLRDQEPHVSSNGRLFSVSGIERISVLDEDRIARRVLIGDRRPTAIMMALDDSLIVGQSAAIVRYEAE